MIYLGLFLLVFLVLSLIRVPIPFSMGIASVLTMVYANVNILSVPMSVANSLNVFTWLAIPAFIFAGDLMAATGIATAIMTVAFLVMFSGIASTMFWLLTLLWIIAFFYLAITILKEKKQNDQNLQ